MTDSIKDRFIEVNEKISRVCIKAGRSREDVSLIVVTKGHPAEKIIEVIEAGALNLGENYPEETVVKISQIQGRLNPIWHMIGHLQSRKIKLMFPTFKLIHSIDSFELANKLNDYFAQKGAMANILVEVNLSGEVSKFGIEADSPEKREIFVKEFEKLFSMSNLNIQGLMTMPPYAQYEDQNVACYNLCHELLQTIKDKYGFVTFNQLSMGTSADYTTAIACGATYVRVGEAIMGQRLKKALTTKDKK